MFIVPSLIIDMSGLNKVFIFFVPIVGLCLVMSLFIKVCTASTGDLSISEHYRIFPWSLLILRLLIRRQWGLMTRS
jgi:hypothetical protein